MAELEDRPSGIVPQPLLRHVLAVVRVKRTGTTLHLPEEAYPGRSRSEALSDLDRLAGLYAPLRVLLYEEERGKTCLEYDRPSSLFGQFGDDRISPTAALLDRKLEALVAAVS